jgi:hypothetical protein
MPQINVTELDFDTIKQNLKTFMQSQAEFSDYNFEGSALSVLLDTLAYNTHYNAVLAHLLANESFLDSAIKRTSVVSLAKTLGYTPRSRRCAVATVNFTITPSNTYTSSTYTLPRDTVFTASFDGTTYTFVPSEAVTATLQDVSGTPKFVFLNLKLKEGKRISNSFLITDGKQLDPVIIPNKDVDTSTLRVRVQTTGSNFNFETYVLHTGILDIDESSKVYFLEETIEGLYSITFGDDVIGKKLTVGNVVIVDYINTNGVAANGAGRLGTANQKFDCNATLTGGGEIREPILTIAAASGGQNKESIDSIKINAPKYNSARERGVTASDYKSLILASNENIQSCSVWGGESNDPPIYGKVFISLDPIPGQIITQQDKDNIVSNIIDPRGSIAILPEFVDPEYTFITLKVGVVYNVNATTLTPGQLEESVSNAISDFFNTELNILNKNFYFSALHTIIKGVSNSIISINIIPSLQKRIEISESDFERDANYTFTFNSRVQPRELHSTWFEYTNNEATNIVKLQDVPDAGVVSPEYNGFGTVFLQSESGSKIRDIGRIDYSTGKITILAMRVSALVGETETAIRVSIRPHDDVNDILTTTLTRTAQVSTAAVIPTPSKNTVLALDDTVKNEVTGARKGLDVYMIPKAEAF